MPKKKQKQRHEIFHSISLDNNIRISYSCKFWEKLAAKSCSDESIEKNNEYRRRLTRVGPWWKKKKVSQNSNRYTAIFLKKGGIRHILPKIFKQPIRYFWMSEHCETVRFFFATTPVVLWERSILKIYRNVTKYGNFRKRLRGNKVTSGPSLTLY